MSDISRISSYFSPRPLEVDFCFGVAKNDLKGKELLITDGMYHEQYQNGNAYINIISNLHNGFLRHSDIAGKTFRAKYTLQLPLDVTIVVYGSLEIQQTAR